MHVSVVDVTNLEQNLQEKITLNSLPYTNIDFKVGTIVLVFGRSLMFFIDIHHVHIFRQKQKGLFCKVTIKLLIF